MRNGQFLQPNRTLQRGAAAVEFGLVAMLLFTLLLGIIEFGRFMYLWNTVQEVTRKAAREAVVSDFTAGVDAIQRTAIFQAGSSGTVSLPAGGEVTNLRVQIRYLNADGVDASPMPASPADNISACLDPARLDSCILYVEAKVCQSHGDSCDPVRDSVQYEPMVGLFTGVHLGPFNIDLRINIPQSTVVMPAESLGYHP